MHYTYQAILPSGQIVRDTAEAVTADALRSRLERDGCQVVEVRIDWRASFKFGFRKKLLKRRVLIDFFSYMKGMLELGMNVTTAINAVKETLDDPLLKQSLDQIEDAATKGYSLSQAIGDTGVFPRLAVASINAAEQANRLEQVFGELSDHYARLEDLVSGARKAATYPAIALFVLTMVFTGLLVFVIPSLRDVLPPDPPPITLLLFFMSDSIAYIWWIPFGIPIAGWIAVKRLGKAQQTALSATLYRIPMIGRIALNLELSTVFMSLAMLNGGGIPLLETFKIVIAGTSSPFLRDRLSLCHELASQGSPLSEGFQDPIFPAVVLRAIAHGEATGRFDKQFAGIAKFLRERTANQIQLLSTFIEPAMILVGGAMLLIMALGIFMPIYGSLKNIGN
ncbi:MAG: type II secretion system F family protein [Myxococcota bacterium]